MRMHWQFKLVTPAACWPRAAVDGHGVSGAGTGSGGEVTAVRAGLNGTGGGGGGGGGFPKRFRRHNFASSKMRAPPAMRAHMRAPMQADATSDRHSSFAERPIKAGKLLRGYHATCALTHRQADRMSSTASQAGENDQTNASKVPNSDRNQ